MQKPQGQKNEDVIKAKELMVSSRRTFDGEKWNAGAQHSPPNSYIEH